MAEHNKITKLLSAVVLTSVLATASVNISNVNQPAVIKAANIYSVRLVHSSLPYNYKGHRLSRKVLKKGTSLKVYGSRKIGKRRYLYIGRGRYIKAANTMRIRRTARGYTVSIANNSNYWDSGHIFRSPNRKPTGIYECDKVRVYSQAVGKRGEIWYRIGHNEWINSLGTSRPKWAKGAKRRPNKTRVSKPQTKVPNKNNSSNSKDKNNKTGNQKIVDGKDLATPEFAKQTEQSFVDQLNELRQSKGLQPLVVDPELEQFARIRVQEIEVNFSHQRPNGQKFKYGEVINGCSIGGELPGVDTPYKTAQTLLNDFIYHDADSNWEHREILLDPQIHKIGDALSYGEPLGMYQGLDFVADVYY